MSKSEQSERKLPAVGMAKAFAPSFGDRPPSPSQPDLREDDDDNGDDFVVKLTTEDNPYPRWFAVPPELIDMLADD